MNEEERKIAAWSIDWEGSIQLKTSVVRPIAPYVHIANTNKDLLNSFKELTNYGKIVPDDEVGYKNGKAGVSKNIFYWEICSLNEVKCFLEEILFYLKAKKLQAKLVIDYCNSRLSKGAGRGVKIPYDSEEWELYDAVRILNKKGKMR